METTYKPYFDPEFEHLIERIHPPRVSIHNDTCRDCTLVKVDSVNKNGILLEMVQVLTDLDLVISKSYICSDGGWFMDVFHVTDQLGNKVTDDSLIFYIQQALCANRRASSEVQTTSIHKDVRPRHISTDQTALEMTGTDRPGLMSEIAAVLAEMGCNVSSAVAWTHNGRVACIIYVEDEIRRGPIVDPCRVAQVQAQLENVVVAHHSDGERRSVRLAAPAAGRTHTERRLHQLLAADGDYEECCCGGCGGGSGGGADGNKWRQGRSGKWCDGTHVTVEYCKEKGYSIVTVRSRDRPKLLFDTVCTLTDMQYVVFHAAISSQGAAAVQEYYVRKKDGCTLDSDKERQRVIQCLIAATERRISHGLRLDVCSRNRLGLLSDITRVLRENGLSIKRAEIGTHGERAVGSFYVTDASGHKVNAETVEAIRKETAGSVLVVNERLGHAPPNPTGINSRKKDNNEEGKPRFSLGSLLWSHVERLSSNFKPIKS